ncbi:carboxymethylenebutenolidase [Bradyrhizobium sacchari]|uniref:Carboxymethylenebutenolidase n=2 Tax=Bradyrhizobium sacchari TaxID=1399419 RepID=A0A560JHM9_9BRAD|nr:carboxymethylenebutenolidase [Bradyrhizobium sacchari]TWB70019.1 carboxymethylenebutenolidase [Bradyrhizobium sacchari]
MKKPPEGGFLLGPVFRTRKARAGTQCARSRISGASRRKGRRAAQHPGHESVLFGAIAYRAHSRQNTAKRSPRNSPEDTMGTAITFKRPDGKDAAGYLANAARGNAPGVVVIQEWWGLSDQIKGLCDRFALAGFDALAPDLYKGKVVPYHDTDSANKEMNSLDFMDATTQTVRGAAQYLSRNGAKVGLTGFCLGGAVTIIGATKIPELAAGVVFYGIPPEQAAKPADVKIPLQAHFANKDDWCTPELVNGFEKAMKAAGKSLELFRYDAEHAFVNEQRQAVHDREAAELAWGRATEFFRKHLG